MDKEKEIEEMAKALHQNCSFAKYGGELLCGDSAKALVNAGYGNVKQAVKEFAEKLRGKSRFICGMDGTPTLMISVSKVDKLIKEICGEG